MEDKDKEVSKAMENKKQDKKEKRKEVFFQEQGNRTGARRGKHQYRGDMVKRWHPKDVNPEEEDVLTGNRFDILGKEEDSKQKKLRITKIRGRILFKRAGDLYKEEIIKEQREGINEKMSERSVL